MPTEEILWNMKNKEVGDVDAVQGSIRGKRYHITDIKYPDYAMLRMITYGTLGHLEVLSTQQRYKGVSEEFATKQFNYCEFFRNHFNYRHQVYNDKNQLHYCISVRTWAKKYWPDWCHA